jgi:hypothetical protein
MPGPSFAAYLSSARAQLGASLVLALAAMALALAVCAAPPAGARPHGTGTRTHQAVTHAHRARTGRRYARVRAHKAACVAAHTRRDSHACSPAKGHKHRTKPEAHHRHAIGSRHAPAVQGKAPTLPAPVSNSPGTTCSNGLNATLNEEGSFACAGGGEPGCQEGFAPVVAEDGTTLVCEPEQADAGGEEEG